MKNKTLSINSFTKITAVIMLAIMMIISAIPFASAATQVDSTKTVSIDLNCTKSGYTFEVFKVADFESTTSSAYTTKYTSLVSDIDSSILSGKTADILAALDAIDDMSATNAVSQGTWTTSETSTTKTFSGLEQGIYYIKAINYPAGVKSTTNSVVALPYFDGSDWVYEIDEVNLADKVVDDVPETHKSITNSTKNNENYTDVSLADTVDFEIRSTTAGSKAYKLNSYFITDDMSAGLTLDKDSFNVALLTEEGTKITDLDASEYTVTVTSENEGENTLFNVALTKDYLQQDKFYEDDVYYTSITYSAVLNKYAVVGTVGNPNTEGKLEYSNKNDVTASVDGNTVYVYTYAVMTNKLDPNENALEGATFALYKTENDAIKQQNEIATGTSDVDGKVLYYNASGEEMKLQSGTYYIVETAAPSGYNLYGKVITITIDAEYGNVLTNGTYVTNCPENGYASVDVIDTAVVLPQTGGTGSMVLYVIGIVLLVVGFTILCIRRKHSN